MRLVKENQEGLSKNLGKITISPKGGKDSKQKDKTFSQRIDNQKNYLFYETQAIQRRELESKESSSEQEHKVNALAQGAEEGRDKLR